MTTSSYSKRRDNLEVYFDRTAVEGWKKLVSKDEKISRIRETVRAGRDRMRSSILSYFPDDLSGWRILDAGCGAGPMSIELARRGAEVTGVDLSPEMIRFARETMPEIDGNGSVTFLSGDMLASGLGRFDAVVSMDSLIHYNRSDAVQAIAELAGRTSEKMVFTIAPKTTLLTLMWAAGKLFPRGDRSPAIEPVKRERLIADLARRPGGQHWQAGRDALVSSGFYISQAVELVRK